MSKKILYIDMDGVIADFGKTINQIDPTIDMSNSEVNYLERSRRVDEICEKYKTKILYFVLHLDEKSPHFHFHLSNHDEDGYSLFKKIKTKENRKVNQVTITAPIAPAKNKCSEPSNA